MLQGGFGAVYKGKLHTSQTDSIDVAVKILLVDTSSSQVEANLKAFMHEAVVMRYEHYPSPISVFE